MDDLRERLMALEAEKHHTERRLEALELRLRSARRRARAAILTALVVVAGLLALEASPQARAQFGITLTSLHNRLMAVELKTRDMTRGPDPNTGQTTVRFSGVNLQVVDGSGTTDGPVNGAGNLIVGYNGSRVPFETDVRTGSHNLIVGDSNNYSRFGGLVVGFANTIGGDYASVSGGDGNTASGFGASVSGGSFGSVTGSNNWRAGDLFQVN